jgi:hypothetical protein
MRYAVTADLHGRRKAWRRFRTGAAAAGADRLVVLGDYLEAEVPWRRHDPARRWGLDEVVEPDPTLWEELAADAELVLGNQELRIRELLRPDQVPRALAPLLRAPETIRFGAALGMHGHQLSWRPSRLPPGTRPDGRGEAALEPDPAGLPSAGLVMAGHSHQTLVLDVTWHDVTWHENGGAESSGGGRVGRVLRVPVWPGRPLAVDWLLAADPAGRDRDRTLFVNVGPARGRPTHWLLYDDDRSQVIFHETA